MRKVRVKICGITNEKDLQLAADSGADALGFVIGFPESPRNLELERAAHLIKKAALFVDTVAVVPASNSTLIEKVLRRCSPDASQLHGEIVGPHQLPRGVRSRQLIKVVSAMTVANPKGLLKYIEGYDAVLVDSHQPGGLGGTGRTHDWKVSRAIREAIDPTPLILAGGLNAVNVTEAISIVRPYAVDVTTGVEKAPGIKDPQKVREFIEAVKRTFIP
jgi:phosphoribosylanthranilate isomerase